MNLQLPLALQLNQQLTLENFLWGENTGLQREIMQLTALPGERFFYIWGASGTGKSHLLQACCHALHHQQRPVIYLPLSCLKQWGADSLENIDEQSLIAIDDLDVVAGDSVWEEALFHLYNRIRDNGQSVLLIAGQKPPANNGIILPDLRSRLSFGLVYQLNGLQDDLKIAALCQKAKQRGFQLSETVALFMLNRCTRNMHTLLQLLDDLDEASLAAKRKITVPFVKAVMGI